MSDPNRPLRVLIAKPGLDGHDVGAKVVCRALIDAGMEVIYTGLRATPEQIVRAALEEDVEAIGLSSLSGAHQSHFTRVSELLAAEGAEDIVLFGGGIIPRKDVDALRAAGFSMLYPPGTPLETIVEDLRAALRPGEGGSA